MNNIDTTETIDISKELKHTNLAFIYQLVERFETTKSRNGAVD